MIEVIVDFTNFKWLLIYICDLFFLHIDIIFTRIFAKYLHFKVLKIKNMIIIGLIVFEKLNAKID